MPMPPLPPSLPVLPPDRKPRSLARWGIAAAVGAVVVVVSVGLFVQKKRATLAPRVDEDRRVVQADIRAALAAAAPVDDAAVRQVLTQFNAAVKSKSPAKAVSTINAKRMAEEILRSPTVPSLPAKDAESVRKSADKIVTGIFRGGEFPVWDKIEVRKITPLDTPGDQVVLAKTYYTDAASELMRYWLHDDGSGLKVYDWESLEFGSRASDLMGANVASIADPKLAEKTKKLMAAIGLSRREAYQEARAAFDVIDFKTLPRHFKPIGLTHRGTVLLSLEEFEPAKASLDEALALKPDLPMALLLRSAVHNKLEEFALAEADARRYIDTLGPRALANYNLGVALKGQNRSGEAVFAYREGLAENVDSLDCMIGLAEVLPPDKQAEIGDAFKKSAFTQATFRTLCEHLDSNETHRALDAVVKTYEAANGSSIDTDFQRAVVDLAEERYADAAALYWKHRNTKDPYFSGAIDTRYLQAMTADGKAVEGYRKSAKPVKGFAFIVDHLDDDRDDAVQHELIALHTAAHPEDPFGWQVKGRRAVADADWATADAAYEKAIELHPEGEGRDASRRGRAFVWCKTDRGLDAYAAPWGGPILFDHIARRFEEASDTASLRRLIELHTPKNASDPTLPFHVGTLQYMSGNYAAAVVSLRQFRDTKNIDPDLLSEATDSLVRSYVRLGEKKALKAETRQFDEHRAWILTKIIAYAALSDGEEAMATYERFLKREGDPAILPNDPELKIALASDAMKPLRDRINTDAAATQPAK